MNINNLHLDWIAAVFALVGVYVIGHRNKYGFLICMVSGLLWCIVAAHTRVYGLYLEVLPLFAVNLHNFNKWRKDERSALDQIAM